MGICGILDWQFLKSNLRNVVQLLIILTISIVATELWPINDRN